MRNYIILNGKNSNQINGLLIQELPPISKPLLRNQIEEIDGRDGDIVTPLGYSAYDKEFTIGLYKDFDVNEVAAYFNSEGTVIFSNEPDKYYYYQITAQIDFERLVRYRTATVTMHCQPFKYSATEQPITEDVSGTVSDEGTNITLENTAEAPFNTLDLKGNTEQDTLSGKNLAYPESSNVASNGIEATYNPSTHEITITGTATATWSIPFLHFSVAGLTLPAGTYILKQRGTLTNGKIGVNLRSSGTILTQREVNSNTFEAVFTIDSDADDGYLFIGSMTANQAVSGTITVQLEAGSTATDFEPYCGGIQSPNPDYPQPIQTVTGLQTVEVRSKNLLPTPDNGTVGGITRQVNSDGTLSLRGTAVTQWPSISRLPYSINTTIHSGTTLTLSLSKPLPNGWKLYFREYYVGGGDNYLNHSIPNNGTHATFTTSGDMNMVGLLLEAPSIGATIDIDGVGIQLEVGQTATAFVPYSKQTYEINLGKNLFNRNDVVNGVPSASDGSIISTSSVGRTSDYIPVVPNTTYSHTGHPLGLANVAWYKADKSFIRRDADVTTVTSPSEAAYARVSCAQGDLGTCQFEAGEPTSYAPYFEPIELCKLGTYQDYIWKDGEDWKIHKATGKYIFTGEENSIWEATVPRIYLSVGQLADIGIRPVFPNSQTSIPSAIVSKFTTKSFEAFYTNGESNGFAMSTVGKNFNFGDKSWTQKSDGQADMNGAIVYYALETPTDTEITNKTLIEQLDDIYYHAHAYKGRTYIISSAATGNVPIIIAAEVGEDNESTITNAGNYLSKPRITVYGSGDISLYINDMHVLQITLGDEGYITIDTAQMEAYKDTIDNLKNRLVIGDYSNARLKPGANKIHFTGKVTKYVVENYSRWL